MMCEILGEAVAQDKGDGGRDASQSKRRRSIVGRGNKKTRDQPKDNDNRIWSRRQRFFAHLQDPTPSRQCIITRVTKMATMQDRLGRVQKRKDDRRESGHKELRDDDEQVVYTLGCVEGRVSDVVRTRTSHDSAKIHHAQ